MISAKFGEFVLFVPCIAVACERDGDALSSRQGSKKSETSEIATLTVDSGGSE